MTIQDVHYDVKRKLNKVDSQQRPNLLIPEIDWAINEAIGIFVKIVAQPRVFSHLGFEVNQRTIDDIRTLVVNNDCTPVTDNLAILPNEYQHFLKGEVEISNSCGVKKARIYIMQHDDMFEETSFTKSSYEWGEVNAIFTEDGLFLHTDNTFIITQACLSYIKKHPYVHNAANFKNGTYSLPSGTVLTGTQNIILPDHTHSEIVDIAVAIISGDINASDYQLKLNKLNLNHLQ